MHTHLVISSETSLVDEWIDSRFKKENARIVPFEIAKISDVRKLTSFTRLGVTEPTVILIHSIDQITSEAGNALLKTLEEPQENLNFVLTATNEFSVLETILSRSSVVRLKKSFGEIGNSQNLIFDLPREQQFEIIEKIKDRQDAITFVKTQQVIVHHRITQNGIYKKEYEALQSALTALNQNGNVSLHLLTLITTTAN